MGDEIKVGASILGYIDEVETILSNLESEQSELSKSRSAFTSAYKGKAEAEIILFYNSFSEHLYRLVNFFGMAKSYLMHTYKEFYYNEEQLIEHTLNKIGG